MSLTKPSLTGSNLIIPSQEGLVSDIPAGDGKIANLILQCNLHLPSVHLLLIAYSNLRPIRSDLLPDLAGHLSSFGQPRSIPGEG